MLMIPANIVASQAVSRRTASMNSRAINGTKAITTVSHRLPAGLRLCSNIASLVFATNSRLTATESLRRAAATNDACIALEPVYLRRRLRRPSGGFAPTLIAVPPTKINSVVRGHGKDPRETRGECERLELPHRGQLLESVRSRTAPN